MATLPQLVAKISKVVPAENEKIIPEKIIPATDEKIYDKYWMTQISILSPDPTKDSTVVVQLVPARDVDVGGGQIVKELMPDASPVTIVERNLFAKAATDEDLANSIVSVLDSIMDIGKEQGLLQ